VNDRGSGSLLAIAIIGAIASMTAVGLPLYAALSARASIRGAADAAALAGADVLSGIAPGDPCDDARRVAAAHSGRLTLCTVDGLVVTVTVARDLLGLTLASSATAGPPVR
jgi:secretion/DNA translocation related TadE-like protein